MARRRFVLQHSPSRNSESHDAEFFQTDAAARPARTATVNARAAIMMDEVDHAVYDWSPVEGYVAIRKSALHVGSNDQSVWLCAAGIMCLDTVDLERAHVYRSLSSLMHALGPNGEADHPGGYVIFPVAKVHERVAHAYTTWRDIGYRPDTPWPELVARKQREKEILKSGVNLRFGDAYVVPGDILYVYRGEDVNQVTCLDADSGLVYIACACATAFLSKYDLVRRFGCHNARYFKAKADLWRAAPLIDFNTTEFDFNLAE